MRITANYNQPVRQTNFGNVLASEKAITYLNESLSPKEIKKVNEIIKDQVGKKPNILLNLGSFQRTNSDRRMLYLRAQVGDMLFKEGLFTSPYGVVKKAAEHVNSLVKKG